MPEKKIPRNFKYSFSETPSTLSDLFSTWIYYSDWPRCDFFSCTGLLGLNRSKLFPSLVANQLTTQKKAIGNLCKKDSSFQNKMEKKRTVFCVFLSVSRDHAVINVSLTPPPAPNQTVGRLCCLCGSSDVMIYPALLMTFSGH